MKKAFTLTQEGLQELQEELNTLIGQRAEITERIKLAREMGDLSENAEYASARSEQDRNELRIKEIEHIVKNAQVMKKKEGTSHVVIGSTVQLQSTSGKDVTYQVVSTVEADPLEGKISDESPIGKELIGKKIGEDVVIATPSDKIHYTITHIA